MACCSTCTERWLSKGSRTARAISSRQCGGRSGRIARWSPPSTCTATTPHNAWADVPQMGASVIVVADGDRNLAQATAKEVGDWVWERRERWHRRPLSVAEALDQGERNGRYPLVLADMADNTGGGAPGDSTEVLRTFVERQLTDALLLYLVDPEVARPAHPGRW